MQQLRHVLAMLQATYTSFAHLSLAPNEQLALGEHIQALMAAIESYAASLAHSSDPTAQTPSLLPEWSPNTAADLAQLFAQKSYDEGVRQSSHMIRKALEGLHAHLKKQGPHLAALQAEMIRAHGMVTKTLWRRGLLWPHSMLAELSEGFGLVYTENQTHIALQRHARETEKGIQKGMLAPQGQLASLRRAIDAVIDIRSQTAMDTTQAQLHALLATLERLIQNHHALENQSPMPKLAFWAQAAKSLQPAAEAFWQHWTRIQPPSSARISP